MQRLLIIGGVAEALNLSVFTLQEWIQYRRTSFIKLGRRIRFSPADIERIQKEGLKTGAN